MGKYKVIYRDEQPLWNEGCPIKITAVQVARNTETGKCLLQTKLQNISSGQRSAIEFSVRLHDDVGNSEEIGFKLLDADLPAGSTMTPEARRMTLSEVTGAETTITRVDDMRDFGSQVQIPEPGILNLSEELLAERKTLLTENGANAELCSGTHVAHQHWWVCGCGAANVQRTTCWNCNAAIELLNKADSLDYLAKKLEADKKQLSEMKLTRAKRNKKALAIFVAIVVVAGISFTTYHAICAEREQQEMYERATASLESENYADALHLFESLGDYKDSEEKAEEVRDAISPEWTLYQRASKELSSGDNTKALKHFESLGDYKDSAEKANEAREAIYQKAVSAFDAGKYSTAAGMFETVGDYADAPQRAEEARTLAGGK